jgi:hypothetical protein
VDNTAEKLIELMGNVISIVVESPVKLKGGKSNPHQGHVTKRSNPVIRVLGNGDYQTRVNEVMESQGKEYTFGARAWGQRTPEGLIEHKGELYVEGELIETLSVEYFLDGKPVEKQDIFGLETKAHQGPINIVTYKISNIKTMFYGEAVLMMQKGKS